MASNGSRNAARTTTNDIVKPPALRSGDRVAIVAPASPFSRDELDAGVAEIARLGFEPVDRRAHFRARSLRQRRRRSCARPPHRRLGRPVDSRHRLRARRLRQRAMLPLPRRRRVPAHARRFSSATATSTSASHVAHAIVGCVAFHGPMVAGRLSHGARTHDPTRFPRRDRSPRAARPTRAGDARSPAARRAQRPAHRRDADATRRLARHAVRLRSACRAACYSSTK